MLLSLKRVFKISLGTELNNHWIDLCTDLYLCFLLQCTILSKQFNNKLTQKLLFCIFYGWSFMAIIKFLDRWNIYIKWVWIFVKHFYFIFEKHPRWNRDNWFILKVCFNNRRANTWGNSFIISFKNRQQTRKNKRTTHIRNRLLS